MEQEAAAEVCVDLEYCVILNNNANANEDAGGRLDTADGKNQGKSCVVVMSSRPDDDDDDDYPLKANDVDNNMNTTSSSSSSVMVLIDERAEDHFIIRGGGGGKEKRKKAAKKPPKPPKHRGAEVDDATDHHHHQMIIKELAELAMIKRARIERMKALIVQKNSSSSSSSSSGGNQIFAMVFTIFVLLVLLFQGGIMSCQISCGTFTGSPPATQANDDDQSSFIFIQETLNPSAHDHDHSAV